jgi:hypothetical protein
VTAAALAEAGAIPTLVRLLKSRDGGVVEPAVDMLKKIANLRAPGRTELTYATAIKSAAAVPTLINLLATRFPQVKCDTCVIDLPF